MWGNYSRAETIWGNTVYDSQTCVNLLQFIWFLNMHGLEVKTWQNTLKFEQTAERKFPMTTKVSSFYHLCVEYFSQFSFDSEMYT